MGTSGNKSGATTWTTIMRHTNTRTPAQPLLDERDRLQSELEALQTKIRGLEYAIELITDEARKQESPAAPKGRDRGITETIRSLLRDAGSSGLSPQMAVELAAARGQPLNPTSVSSLLSRMKRDGQVAYRRKRYVLTEDA